MKTIAEYQVAAAKHRRDRGCFHRTHPGWEFQNAMIKRCHECSVMLKDGKPVNEVYRHFLGV